MARSRRRGCSPSPSLLLLLLAALAVGRALALRSLYVAFEERHPILDRDAYLGALSDWTHAPASSLLAANVSARTDAASGALLLAANESEAFSALYLTPAHLRLAGMSANASASRYTPLHTEAAAHASLRGCATVLRPDQLALAQLGASADCRALRAATFAIGGDAGSSHFILEYRVRLRALGPDRASGVRALSLGLIDAAASSEFAAFALGVSSGVPVHEDEHDDRRSLRTLMYIDGENCSRCEALTEAYESNCLSIVPVVSSRANAVASAYADASSRLTPWLLVRTAFIGDSQQVYLSTLTLVYNASEAAYRVLDQTKTPWLLVPNHKRVEKAFFPYSSSAAAGDAIGWMPAVGLATVRGDAEVRGFRLLEYDARAMSYTGGPLTMLAEEDARANVSSTGTGSSGSNTATASTASTDRNASTASTASTGRNASTASTASSPSNASATPIVVLVATVPFRSRLLAVAAAADETSGLLVLVSAAALALTLMAACSFGVYTRVHSRVLLDRRAAHNQRAAVWAETDEVALRPIASTGEQTLAHRAADTEPTLARQGARSRRGNTSASVRYNSLARGVAAAAASTGSRTASGVSYTQRSMSIDGGDERGTSALLDGPSLEAYGNTSLAVLAEETAAEMRVGNASSPDRLITVGGGGSEEEEDDDDDEELGIDRGTPRSASLGTGTMRSQVRASPRTAQYQQLTPRPPANARSDTYQTAEDALLM